MQDENISDEEEIIDTNCSDDEWKVPNSCDSDDSSSCSSSNSRCFPMLLLSTSEVVQESTSTKSSNRSAILRDECVSSSTDVSKITVMTTSNRDGRCYDKRYYCLYCNKGKAKIPRHLTTQHKNEPEVIKYVEENDPITKRNIMMKLRNLGNHYHNVNVIREKKGVLIVAYRPQNSSASADDYLPCEHCLGYYSAPDLWKHTKRCPLADSTKQRPHKKVQESAKLLLPPPKGASTGLQTVLASMNKDEIGRIVKADKLILQLGEKLFLKNGHDREQHGYIRNVLRELGRLLKDLRGSTGNSSAQLIDFIDPKYFMTVVKSARQVAGFCEEKHTYNTPSLALKLGHSVKKCSKIVKGNALQSGDEEALTKSSAFFELCELNWTEEVSTHALRTLSESLRNKPKLIPLTQDVTILTNHLKEVGEKAFNKLCKDNKSQEDWCRLSEVSLCQLILFNRRRQGEVSKMRLSDYEKKQIIFQEDINPTLSPLEQKLCRVLHRIEIIGKRGRTVPVLLTAEMCLWIDIIVQCRLYAGVNPENDFVFPCCRYASLGHLRGCDSLRAYSESCGAKYPELIRSTKLRKQIATLSQLLNLKENELDILTDFLGHDVRVHREFYRMPQETLQVAKVSKLLLAMEKGVLSEQRGKSLDEIEVEVNEGISSVVPCICLHSFIQSCLSYSYLEGLAVTCRWLWISPRPCLVFYHHNAGFCRIREIFSSLAYNTNEINK